MITSEVFRRRRMRRPISRRDRAARKRTTRVSGGSSPFLPWECCAT